MIIPERSPASVTTRLRQKVQRLLDARRFHSAVKDEVARFRPDVIHCHYGTTAATLEPTLRELGIPFIISFYGYDISQGMCDPRTNAAYRALMKLNPLVHVLCDDAHERALSLGCPEDRIVNANLPLPVERYPFVGVQGSTITRWLIPARFVEKKGHRVLIEAFRELATRDSAHQLTCWGGYGDPRALQDQVIALGLGDAVRIVDNRDEGPFDQAYVAQLRRHDVVLAPSVKARGGDDEGGPALTAVLAQVAGKPVIFSDFPGSERSVTNGVEGLIVRQGDAPALAEAMHALAQDPARAARMGEAGRNRALQEFSRAAYRDALLNWYRRLAL